MEGEGHNEHVEQWVPMHHEGAHRRAPRERGKGRHTVSKPLVAASVVKVAWACGILNKKNWERVLCQRSLPMICVRSLPMLPMIITELKLRHKNGEV